MKKLGKLKMPARKEELDLSELEDKEMPEMEEGEALEGEEDVMEASEEEIPSDKEMPLDLSALSDDELMAEIKKRGLMSDLAQSDEAEEEMGMEEV